jgi:ribosomal protein S18 acetylase RimI-like enzyme
MATDEAHRDQGLGALVLAALVEHARKEGAERVWCLARMNAIGFYEGAGWEVVSDEPIYVPGVGEHRRMGLSLIQSF